MDVGSDACVLRQEKEEEMTDINLIRIEARLDEILRKLDRLEKRIFPEEEVLTVADLRKASEMSKSKVLDG